MNSSLSGNEYNDSKYYYYPSVVATDTYNFNKRVRRRFFFPVTKIVTSALWTYQFYFTQMKAVSLGLHIFWKSEEFSDLLEKPFCCYFTKYINLLKQTFLCSYMETAKVALWGAQAIFHFQNCWRNLFTYKAKYRCFWN